jgi:hypothetical protein
VLHRRVARIAAVTAALLGLLAIVAVASAGATTTYTPGTASVDGVLDAPWNTSQGDLTEASPYYTPGDSSPTSPNLFPTFSFASFATTPDVFTTIGGVTEPNVSVYAGANAPPYASGVAGTPGPLDGYCSSGGANPETGAPAAEPTGTDLPMSPYYFPDVVRNADGSLTGYFDWRPKDANEQITVARSTDGGVTWTTEGQALQQNGGYCPNADTNDDGQGHPFVMAVGATSYLYTLQRAAGDNPGVGLLVHQVNPSASNPLSTLPPREPVGIDPNTFATAAVAVPTSSGVSIAVSTLGSAGSPEQILAGTYEDVPNGSSEPSSSTAINCTGPTSDPTTVGPGSLSGCTSLTGSSVSVNPGDDLIQVLATGDPTSSSGSKPCTTIGNVVPSGPNNDTGSAGLSALCFSQLTPTIQPTIAAIVANEWGALAPNRVYIDGHTLYCPAMSSALVKFENCTTTGSSFDYETGDDVTADPIVPPSAAAITTGLDAPDGIIGALPGYTSSATYAGNGGTFNGAPVPSNATVVLYTEKIANYFIEGTTNGDISKSGNYQSGTVTLPLSASFTPPQTQAQWLNFQPSATQTEPLPDEAPATGSFTVYVGVTDSSGNFIQPLTCTSWEPGSATTGTKPPAGSINLIGCNGQGTSAESIASATEVGGPNASIVPYSVIAKIGEGKNGGTSGPTELFGNNEDYEAVRAAYTTDGIHFTDLGAISGSTSGTGSTTGGYNDLSNPDQQASPLSSGGTPVTSAMTACGGTTGTSCVSPANAAPGSADTVELRWPGSRGTIVQNPDGSYGMFLSGAWPTDADSDAFNQIFYSSSSDGLHWSVPQVISSTDYTFSASAAQEPDSSADGPLGISGYYSGRDYGPAVVQNPNGTLTMVFAGYRTPKGTATEGDVLGTNPSALYTVGDQDPNLYRNILTAPLGSSSDPLVGTSSTLGTSGSPVTYGTQVTYTDTISVLSPGVGSPTGTVDFYDGGTGNPISNCQNVALSANTATASSTPDTASCMTTPAAGSHSISAVYSGDGNYATSTGDVGEQVNPAPLTVTALNQSRLFGQPNPTLTYKITGFVNNDPSTVVSGSADCTTTATATSIGGGYPITCTQGTLTASNYSFTTFVPATLTVGYSRVVTGLLAGIPTTVPPGQSWELGRGAFVLGALDIPAGSSVDVEPGAVVLGAIVASGADTVRICGASMLGVVSATGDSGPVLIGDGTTGCAGSSIAGEITLRNDTGGVTIEKAHVLGSVSVSGGSGGVSVIGNDTGPLSVTGNSGGATVTGNTVTGSLTVTGNSGTVVDRPNTVFGVSHLQ